MQIIKLEDVCKHYGNYIALQDISFSIADEQITVLMGPNGAGKSTLAKIILNLEKATSGQIVRANGLKYGYIPQKVSINNRVPITAGYLMDIISGGGYIREFDEFSDIENLKNKSIDELSGGQFQKVLLSSTLIHKPNVLILDEPITGLDIESQEMFYSIIQKVRYNMKISIIIISHDLSSILESADQVICIDKTLQCSHSYINIHNKAKYKYHLKPYSHEHRNYNT